MNKTFVGAIALVACAGAALGDDISQANGYQFRARVFNDFPVSALTFGPAGTPVIPAPVPGNYPLAGLGSGLEVLEVFPQFTPGNFANRHDARFSADGGLTPLPISNGQSFEISTTLTINANVSPRKEAGIIIFNDRGGGFIDEGRVNVTSDGEVAVFGANMLFSGNGEGLGNGVYTVGTTAQMTYRYFAPGTIGPIAAYQVIFIDAVTGVHDTGIRGFDPNGAIGPNAANGINTGSNIGFVVQSQRNPLIADTADVIFGNVSVVPAPGAAALLGLGGLVALRRRR